MLFIVSTDGSSNVSLVLGDCSLLGDFVVLISGSFSEHRRRQWHPTPVLLSGKSHGWRSLEGCSPWGLRGSDTTISVGLCGVWLRLFLYREVLCLLRASEVAQW